MSVEADSWPHRYDAAADLIGFIPVPRQLHAECTFITDEHLPPNLPVTTQAIGDSTRELAEGLPTPHYVFHSAYCCSTMIARAFDLPGVSMGLKEPQILNDILGVRRRGKDQEAVRNTLDTALGLLSRPFNDGELNVIKPSNIVNPLAELMLELRPSAQALFLYAPIESYLQSIAKKGMWGRRWVRQALIATIEDKAMIGGFEDQNLLELTDLQVAAMGWLSQHSLFTRLQSRFGESRIRTLDSATLLADQVGTMQRLLDHFQISLSDDRFDAMMAGPAFTTHSKDSSVEFDASKREKEQASMAEVHGEEIGMVSAWTQAVADSQGISLELSGSL